MCKINERTRILITLFLFLKVHVFKIINDKQTTHGA